MWASLGGDAPARQDVEAPRPKRQGSFLRLALRQSSAWRAISARIGADLRCRAVHAGSMRSIPCMAEVFMSSSTVPAQRPGMGRLTEN